MNAQALHDPTRGPVFDWDFFAPCREGETFHVAIKRLQEEAPAIFWTPRNGGHWVATQADDILVMQQDYARFSNNNCKFPVVERPFKLLPLEVDPPEHGLYRLLIAPAFSPKAIARVEHVLRAMAVKLIDELAPRGHCEFVSEFSKVLPIVVFLGMMELPAEDRHILLPHAEAIARSQDQAVANVARVEIGRYLARWVALRRDNPGDDAISRVATAAPGGRPLTDDEILGVCSLVLVGGLDTVASLLSFTAAHLAECSEDRRRLREHPELLPDATEELFRRFGIVHMNRVVTEDIEIHGAPLRKGDFIVLPSMLVGLDEGSAAEPLAIDINRKKARHAIFGGGPHRCPGAQLARREMAVFLEEWLRRIPDFWITPGTRPHYNEGTVNTMTELHLSWDPAAL